MIRVKATREGLVNHVTSSGYRIDNVVSFVALPSVKALHRHVRVRNPENGKECIAEVLDVGPWNIHDDAYVFQWITENGMVHGDYNVRPAAESDHSLSGKGTNGAGIDLGERVWNALGMTDNSDVEWEFVS